MCYKTSNLLGRFWHFNLLFALYQSFSIFDILVSHEGLFTLSRVDKGGRFEVHDAANFAPQI